MATWPTKKMGKNEQIEPYKTKIQDSTNPPVSDSTYKLRREADACLAMGNKMFNTTAANDSKAEEQQSLAPEAAKDNKADEQAATQASKASTFNPAKNYRFSSSDPISGDDMRRDLVEG